MTKTLPPRLPIHLPSETLTQLEAHREYAAMAVSGGDFTDQSASGVRFEEVSLRSTAFTGSRLPGLRLLDVRLSECDLSGAFLEEARFRELGR